MRENPCRKLSRLKEPPARDRFLSPDELQRLLEECRKSAEPALHLFVFLAVNTGMRFNEVRTLRWSDIQLNAERPYIGLRALNTKTQRSRYVPLREEVAEEPRRFHEVRGPMNPYVFYARKPCNRTCGELADIRSDLTKAIKAAKLENIRPHDLRHTCASYLALRGTSLRTIAKILGHTDLKMTMRYSHLNPAHLHDAIQVLSEVMPKKVA